MDGFEKIRQAQESNNRHEREQFEVASGAMGTVGSIVNGGSREATVAGLLDGLLRTHRYLANEAIVALLTALGDYGAFPEHAVSDARNQFAYKLCQKLRETFKDELFWKDGQ